jgi:pimeloyl-ACP methyl ester carboxylesterase
MHPTGGLCAFSSSLRGLKLIPVKWCCLASSDGNAHRWAPIDHFIKVKMYTQWTQGNIPVNNGYLHYYRTGHGEKEPILLVHGFSDNGLCWTPVARELEKNYDVIMPDMKSHGLSASIREKEPVDMTSDLVKLIQSLGLSHPIIVGHSMGAMIAFQAGVQYPTLAKAMILEDPPWLLSQQGEENTSEETMLEWARKLPSQSIEELETINRKDHPTWTDEMIQLMSESKKQFDPTSVDMLLRSLKKYRTEWLSTIGTINFPLLIMTGNPELGAIVTREVATRIHELNPEIQIKNVPDVGHLIRFDKFDEFMSTVFAFLGNL